MNREEIVESLVRKYGESKARLFLKYYDSNIPERFWNKKYSQKFTLFIDRYVTLLEQGIWLVFFRKSSYELSLIISAIMKQPKFHYKKKYFFDYDDVIHNYNDFNLRNELMMKFNFSKMISITNIVTGDEYEKRGAENIITILNKMMNSRIEKQIILGFEVLEGYDSLEDQFGFLYNHMRKNDNLFRLVGE